MLRGKLLRTFRHEINMRTLTENLACCTYRIPQMLDTSYAPRAKRRAVHDQRIELNFTVAVEEAAAAGIKRLVIFHDHDCFFNRIERSSAFAQSTPAHGGGIAHSEQMGLNHIVGNRPRATVDKKDRIR